MKQRHFIAGLLPTSSAVYLPSTKKYHSGTGWLPANIFVSHASSPICTPYHKQSSIPHRDTQGEPSSIVEKEDGALKIKMMGGPLHTIEDPGHQTFGILMQLERRLDVARVGHAGRSKLDNIRDPKQYPGWHHRRLIQTKNSSRHLHYRMGHPLYGNQA